DVDLFFRALRSAYGAYWYFGGDEVFLPVKDAVLAELADKPPLTAASVGRILLKHLEPVVKDGGFAIDGASVWSEDQSMYYVPELYFAEGDTDADAYVRPTIGPDGEVTYCFAALSADGADLPDAATVAGEKKTLNWVKAEADTPDSKSAYETTNTKGIPTLVCRTLSAAEDAQGVKDLIAAAPQWQKELCFMIDLRGNNSGEAANAAAWFKAFADSDAPTKNIRLQNCSRLLSAYGQSTANYNNGSFMDRIAANAGTWAIAVTEGGQVPSDSLIFVLQDGQVGGAGEGFLKYLSTLENVIFVGSNSKGDAMMDNEMAFTLPKTGVAVRFSGTLDLFRTTDNSAGTGLLPDLWVPPQDAPEAVARLARCYGLM
ncbi:MAG: hypothetical protein EOM52_12000, partial [Clostridia bacterium]|nr:hypothetical protein [Clostridia bacterium]